MEVFTEAERRRAEAQALKDAKRKVKTLTSEQEIAPAVVSISEGRQRGKRGGRRKRRQRLPSSKQVLRGVRKVEKQATSVFRDAPPNIIGLRRKPRRARIEIKKREFGIIEDRRSSQEILDEFLS